jgi:hypothetical protein
MRFYVCRGRSKKEGSKSKRSAADVYFDKDCNGITKEFGPALHKPTNSTNKEKKSTPICLMVH